MIRTRLIVDDILAALRAHAAAVSIWVAIATAWRGLNGMLIRQMTAVQTIAGDGRPPVAPTIASGAISLGVTAVLLAAAMRAVFAPADRRKFYLRLGPDELRLYGLFLLATVLWIVGGFVAGTLFTLLLAVIGVWTRSAGTMVGVSILLGIALLAAAFYVSARLLPIAGLTVLRHRFALAAGWRLSERRVRPLLGAVLVVAAIVFVAMLALGLAAIAIAWREIGALVFRTADASYAAAIAAFRLRLMTSMSAGMIVIRLLAGMVGGLAITLQGLLIGAATMRLLDDKAGIDA